MTETESWILNEFANDVVWATKIGDQALIEACQKEYDDYWEILQRRTAGRKAA